MEKKYYPLTGLEEIRIADVTADDAAAYTAGTPEYFAPGQKADWASEQASEDVYADNQLQDTFYGSKKEKIIFQITGISEEKDAEIRGIYHDSTVGRTYSSGNESPPDKAMGIKMNKGKDGYVYIWFLKGTITGGNIVAETKKDGVTVSTREYTFNGKVTTHKFDYDNKEQGCAWSKGDTTTTNFDGSTWFNAVQTPPEIAA